MGNPDYELELDAVLTIRKVMEEYGFKYHTQVQYFIDAGRIHASKQCGTWILSKSSVRDCLGSPLVKLG